MKTFGKIIIFICIIFVLNAYKLSAQEKIKIGLLVPLTGKDAEIGQSIIKATTLKVGQIVEINQKKHKGQKFIIKKVNRTKCVIVSKDNAFESYTCPISMLICS